MNFSAATSNPRTAVLLTPNDHPLHSPLPTGCEYRDGRSNAKRKRQMLLAMATGTGKTFTMVNEIYRLMEAGVAKRVLFLVDRRILAAQAVRAFASFEAKPGLKFDQIYEVYSQRFQPRGSRRRREVRSESSSGGIFDGPSKPGTRSCMFPLFSG